MYHALHIFLVVSVVDADVHDLSCQRFLQILIKFVDVVIHVFLEIFQEDSLLPSNISINSQESWNLQILDVDEVLILEVRKQDLASVSSVFWQSIEDVESLLGLNWLSLLLYTILVDAVRLSLIIDKVIVPIDFGMAIHLI